MNDAPLSMLLALLAWGTLVGLDLVSFPQMLLSRPLVAGTVAGLLLGDMESGVRVGAVLELFALDVLPVGAARYPDFGPATVAAVALAAGHPWQEALGPAVFLGLMLSAFGGWTMQRLRQANARAIEGRTAALAAGEAPAIRHLQYRGVLSDFARSLLLTSIGVAWAALLHALLVPGRSLVFAALAAIGTGLAAALGGAVRSAGKGLRLRALAVGLGLGLLVALL